MSAEITCNKNGPLLVKGDFKILDPAGGVFDLGGRTTVALCRCGQSSKKPFCDGTHNKCGFVSEVSAAS